MIFCDFFRSATKTSTQPDGRAPYPYQTAFADAETLPELLNVPTGVGKTATAILGWLYRRREAAIEIRLKTPRRLVYCLPMRTLVEQTQESAKDWLNNLGLSAEVGIHILMGGADDNQWDENPERDAILIGTQDMLLSRALNRGYGMSRYRWPIHFGLLNNDSMWVMDETQLMGVGLTTTAQLQGLRLKLSTYGVTHSLWMSATLDESSLDTVDHPKTTSGFTPHTLTVADQECESVKKRLAAKKTLEVAKIILNSESEKKNYAKELASTIQAAHREGTLTLVVMNRVARAQQVFNELQNLQKPKSKPSPIIAELALIHARFRPCDRKTHEQSLFSNTMPEAGRIVVATQAIEAGVDVSAATLITELAPWSSMVQRFGRCNRAGEFTDARVIWINATLKDDKDKIALPYESVDFEKSRRFLEQLCDVGPTSLNAIHNAQDVPIVHTLRRKDLLDLWDTTSDLAGNDLDVSRFIRDGDDIDVQFFWRDFLEKEPSGSLVAAHRHELCSVAIWRAKEFLTKLKKNDKQCCFVWKPLEKDKKWQRIDSDEVRPGMVLLLQTEMGGYLDTIGWTGNPSDSPTPRPPITGEVNEDNDDGMNAKAFNWISLTQHLDDVVRAASELQTDFSGEMAEVPWNAIITAARWHDVGKSHPAFQNMLVRNLANRNERLMSIWAKSDGTQTGRPRYFAEDEEIVERIGFRHELASALSWLSHQGNHPDVNLIAYLIAAHHGKVRGSIRSLPNEIPPLDPTIKFARGIWDGDILPSVELDTGEIVPSSILDLGLMELGQSSSGESWLARVIGLRDNKDLGPFRLSYLETLLRVADWRGSNAGRNTNVK